jgi:phosphatidylserine decarboxylase
MSDNRGRGEAEWNWPAIHPEGRKFGLIAVHRGAVPASGSTWN